MNGQNYCVPFRSDIYPDYNIMSSIWNNQTNYQTKNIDSTVFLNYTKYSPNNKFDYNLYYGDTLFVQNTTTKKFLNYDNKKLSSSNFGLKLGISFLTLLPENAIVVRNYNVIILNIYNTFLVIQDKLLNNKTNTNEMEWVAGLGQNTNKYQYIIIECIDKPNYEPLNYDDKFRLIMNQKYIAMDTNENIILVDTNDKELSKYHYEFKFIPKFIVTYCENPNKKLDLENINKLSNNYCNTTTIDKATRLDDGNFVFNNSRIYRDLWCFGQCKNTIYKNKFGDNFLPRTSSYKKDLIYDQIIIGISSLIVGLIIIILLNLINTSN